MVKRQSWGGVGIIALYITGSGNWDNKKDQDSPLKNNELSLTAMASDALIVWSTWKSVPTTQISFEAIVTARQRCDCMRRSDWIVDGSR